LHQHHPPLQLGGWQLELANQLGLDNNQQRALQAGAVQAEHAEVGALNTETDDGARTWTYWPWWVAASAAVRSGGVVEEVRVRATNASNRK
jgi:hypothetical protein